VPEPTSWLTIEPGWEVEDPSGTRVGRVSAVIGDPDADIFDGLRLKAAEGGELYLPADAVGAIVDGRVSLDSSLEQLARWPAEDEPGGAEIRPEAPGEP
jgi:hypothetical protein